MNATLTKRDRQAQGDLDIRDLPYPPEALGGIAVSTTEQDESYANQKQDLQHACDTKKPLPFVLRRFFEFMGSRSEFREAENSLYTGLLAAVKAGEGDVIAVKAAARITRIITEGDALLKACIERERVIWFYLYGSKKLYNPRNKDDFWTLYQMFVDAAKEAAETRARTYGGLEKARSKGRNVGITPYGYTVWYDAASRRPPLPVREIAVSCTRQGCPNWYRDIPYDLVNGKGQPPAHCPACGAETAPLQAEIVREITGWAAEGRSLATIALRLNKRGTPAPTRRKRDGTLRSSRGHWAHETVLAIATNPCYIGYICTDPPGGGGPRKRDLGRLTPAPSNPVIVDEETFFMAAKHLLLRGQVRHSMPETLPGLPAGTHVHRWVAAEAGQFTCAEPLPNGKACKRQRRDRPGAAKHDATHIAICSVHRAAMESGDKAEVAPKDVHLNAMRDLWAACGGQLEAAARDGADGILRALRSALLRGLLAPGSRLPSSRALATRLGLTRSALVRAYDELAAAGSITVRPQSGMFVAGGEPDVNGKRAYTGRYRRYYRCSSNMDVHVPMDEANAEIARQVAAQLCSLHASGGFTRRITSEHAQALSEREDARYQEAYWTGEIRAHKPRKDDKAGEAYLATAKANQAEAIEAVERLEAEVAGTAVPACLKVFRGCNGIYEAYLAKYLGLETDQRRAVLRELTDEIVMFPAKKKGRGHNEISDRVRVTRWAPWYAADSDEGHMSEDGRVTAAIQVPEGCKLCSRCGQARPADLEHFRRNSAYEDGWADVCLDCQDREQAG
jgi:DNA invertase Pin-like site-specific DNA recombinase